MRNLKMWILAALITANYACRDTQKNNEKTVEAASKDTAVLAKVDAPVAADTTRLAPAEEPEETRMNDSDSIDFEKYHVAVPKQVHAPINWSSYPEARSFKTRIMEAYKTDTVDFAGHYVMSVFGCGAGCIMGFMVDVRDGKIYDLPLGEENSCFFAEKRALGNASSRLFIAGVCKENAEAKKVFYMAYLWNEDKKEFEKVEESAFLKK